MWLTRNVKLIIYIKHMILHSASFQSGPVHFLASQKRGFFLSDSHFFVLFISWCAPVDDDKVSHYCRKWWTGSWSGSRWTGRGGWQRTSSSRRWQQSFRPDSSCYAFNQLKQLWESEMIYSGSISDFWKVSDPILIILNLLDNQKPYN